MNKRNSFVGIGRSGNFLHYCHCGAWGMFGHGVSTLAGEFGVWYCAEHNPTDAQKVLATRSYGPPEFRKLVERFGGYHLVPEDEFTNHEAAVREYQARLRMLHKMGKGGE
jgi:hypothetical protein